MSSYAALVSLLQILGTLLDPGRLVIISNRPQLQSLHEKAIFLLDFLDKSSTCKAALETKMREAAHKAEDLIEFQISQILDSDSRSFRNSMKFIFRRFSYVVLVLILSSILFPATFTQAKAIPVPIQIFMLRVVIPILLAVATCTINAVFFYLYLYNFPATSLFQALETQEFRRVLYDFDIIVKEVIQIKEACRDMEMSARAALIPLRQILDSHLDSGGVGVCHNRGQLDSLQHKVIFLLDFLANASTYMLSHKSEMEIVEVKIREAVYKAKALIEFQIPAQFIMDSDKKSFSGLMKVSLLELLPLVPVFTIIILGFSNSARLILASFPQVMPLWIRILMAALIVIALSFGVFVVFVLCTSGVVVVLRFLAATNNSGEQENQELRLVIDEFSVIERNVIEIKGACGNPSDLPATATASSRSDLGRTGRNVVVGLDNDLKQIKEGLARNSSKLEVVSIVGMAGIGKTTLAKQVYDDPYSVYKFDIRAWITVSQEYSFRHVLLGLLDSAKKLTKEMQEENDDRLAQHLYQNLMGRTYLIVMDDVWSTKEIWDSVGRYFPENRNGSRVLLTSQLQHVASYPKSCSTIHQMQGLNENDSWDLLRENVFGAEGCPLELVSIGKEIARRCRRLPLAIVVIGGLLYKDSRSEIWRDIAKNLNSILRQSKERYLEILGLSYNHLPHHLRPCFLYMGVFLGDGEIPVSRLINLWVAEGFLQLGKFETLEEVAEDNLKNLIDRNLVLVCKQSCNGKIRTCSMHGLLRDVSQQKALKENFLHVVDRGGYVTRDRRDETPRRLSIRSDALRVDARHDLISRYYNVRSFLCTSMLFDYQPVVYLGFVYLRVLDVVLVHFSKFPESIIGLILLRYLAFHYDGPLPPSMSKLQNLETIVHHHCSFHSHPLLPGVIWSMTNLRHLYVKPGCYLSNPLSFRLPWKSCALEHLQTLVGIRNFRWSKGMINRIPNLKKLGISYQVSSSVDWAAYQLESLVDLIQLESLKIIIKCNDEGSAIPNDPPKLAFPQKLKKLSLSGCGIPWASMTTIGALQNLEALKLRCEAFCGHSWETVEGEFPQLRFLLLEDMSFRRWETEADHFPRLQRVVVRSCGVLEEIPYAVGDIPTLGMIHLVDCLPSAVDSAKQIQEDQKENGNEGLKVQIS